MFRKLTAKLRSERVLPSTHSPLAPCSHCGVQPRSVESLHSNYLRQEMTSGQLKEILKARRAREFFFGFSLCSDPAWEIILIAYAASLDGQSPLLRTVIQESDVPATTLLRWLKTLEKNGLLEPIGDPFDSSQAILKLSATGKMRVERYVSAVWPGVPLQLV